MTPGDAELRLELGQVLSEFFSQQKETLALHYKAMKAGATVLLVPSSLLTGDGAIPVIADAKYPNVGLFKNGGA